MVSTMLSEWLRSSSESLVKHHQVSVRHVYEYPRDFLHLREFDLIQVLAITHEVGLCFTQLVNVAQITFISFQLFYVGCGFFITFVTLFFDNFVQCFVDICCHATSVTTYVEARPFF